MTETPHSVERRLRDALIAMVYETTSLSPMEVDGSHWCKISASALANARAALAQPDPSAGEGADALKLADEYAAKRDWNGAYHAMRIAYFHAAPSPSADREAVACDAAEGQAIWLDKRANQIDLMTDGEEAHSDARTMRNAASLIRTLSLALKQEKGGDRG